MTRVGMPLAARLARQSAPVKFGKLDPELEKKPVWSEVFDAQEAVLKSTRGQNIGLKTLKLDLSALKRLALISSNFFKTLGEGVMLGQVVDALTKSPNTVSLLSLKKLVDAQTGIVDKLHQRMYGPDVLGEQDHTIRGYEFDRRLHDMKEMLAPQKAEVDALVNKHLEAERFTVSL